MFKAAINTTLQNSSVRNVIFQEVAAKSFGSSKMIRGGYLRFEQDEAHLDNWKAFLLEPRFSADISMTEWFSCPADASPSELMDAYDDFLIDQRRTRRVTSH